MYLFIYFKSACEIHSTPVADPPATYPHVEDTAGVRNSLGIGLCVSAAAANVKADADHLQAQLLGPLQETSARSELRTKLDTEATHRLGVVGGDAQHQPGGDAAGQQLAGPQWQSTDLSSFSAGMCLTWRCRDNGPLS